MLIKVLLYSDVLTELMTENGELFTDSLLGLPTSPPPLVRARPQVIGAVLRAPTAYCIKNTQEELTYLQKGEYKYGVIRSERDSSVDFNIVFYGM